MASADDSAEVNSENNSAEIPSTSVKKPIMNKKTPDDFIFGKVIGEGSFSTVFRVKELSTDEEYAIKMLEKRHLVKEKKAEYAVRERDVLSRINHPFFVKLNYSFQDPERLYFVLTLAKRGELLDYIKKLGCFDEQCSKFYAAEMVLALEYLCSVNIIHRDLKPENILLGDDMHILITDFGSTKIVTKDGEGQRKNSFVGTAQYVSPELLTNKQACYSSDLWALGCIIYQMMSGQLPFWGGNDYQIFQKILKLEYTFPEGFNSKARDIVEKLLVLEPSQRLGSDEQCGFADLKKHPFFEGINWENLPSEKPPELLPYLPASGENIQAFYGDKPGFQPSSLIQHFDNMTPEDKEIEESPAVKDWISDEERNKKLTLQLSNDYHRFVDNNLILKQGLVIKRKGFSSKRRMLLLTEGPRLYYVDPQAMVLKGEIPWSKDLQPDAKNFKIFFVHTPNRTYYLEDPEGNALKWCEKIDKVLVHYYGDEISVDGKS